MKFKRSTIVLMVIGVLLILLAPIERFALVPILTKLPGSTDLKLDYAGNATLLNSKALAADKIDLTQVVAKDPNLTLNRHIKVTKTDGDDAVVQDDITVNAGGNPLPYNHTFGIDRTSLEGVDGVKAPDGKTIEPAKDCITVTLPIGPKDNSDNYRLYDPASQLCFPLTYVDKDKRKGRDVYKYTSTQEGPLKDKALQTAVPKELPKAKLAQLAPLLTKEQQAKIGPALGTLPDVVPLKYQVKTLVEVYADTQTGLPLDEMLDQTVTVGVEVNGSTEWLMPVLAMKANMDDKSIKKLADKAKESGRMLIVLKWVAPILFLVLGIGLVLLAVFFGRRAAARDAGSTGPTAGPSENT